MLAIVMGRGPSIAILALDRAEMSDQDFGVAVQGETTRRSLHGGVGVTLSCPPSEPKTIQKVSQAVGKITKRVGQVPLRWAQS